MPPGKPNHVHKFAHNEVPIKNKELTSGRQKKKTRRISMGQKEGGDTSLLALPTTQEPSPWDLS